MSGEVPLVPSMSRLREKHEAEMLIPLEDSFRGPFGRQVGFLHVSTKLIYFQCTLVCIAIFFLIFKLLFLYREQLSPYFDCVFLRTSAQSWSG